MLKMEMRAEEGLAVRIPQAPPVFVLEYPAGDIWVYWLPRNGGESALATMAESPTTGSDPHEIDIDPSLAAAEETPTTGSDPHEVDIDP